ncbi:MAG TPA: noncanonical pyrimidine nucleotidase, YjjG family [Sediminispirochaeta sp.]|nr:noncanonical pyrimidine nucleotidase, YjjG family [Sediminispirochaeta sp.]
MSMPDIQAILFDFDDTLINYSSSEEYGLREAFQKFGIPLRSEYLDIYREENKKLWKMIETGDISTAELRIQRFEKLLDRLGFETGVTASRLSESYLEFFAQAGDLEEGAREILQWIHEHKELKKAIITNGFTDTQHKRIGVTQLGDFFDEIFISDEMGAKKPDPLIFEKALGILEIDSPEKVLIVGDNLVSDIMGGKRYGLLTCWYNPTEKDPEEYRQYIDFQISHLSELSEVLNQK